MLRREVYMWLDLYLQSSTRHCYRYPQKPCNDRALLSWYGSNMQRDVCRSPPVSQVGAENGPYFASRCRPICTSFVGTHYRTWARWPWLSWAWYPAQKACLGEGQCIMAVFATLCSGLGVLRPALVSLLCLKLIVAPKAVQQHE